MTEDRTFSQALARATPSTAHGLNTAVTALYPSAGCDTAPFQFLHRAFLRHRAAWGVPTPDLFVYTDRFHPHDPAAGGLTYVERRRDDALVVETRSVEALTVEGHPSSLLTVQLHSDVPSEERTYRVLRIRIENEEAFAMFRNARWAPDVYIAPDDGCCFGGGNLGRCENSLDPEVSPVLGLVRPPRWWVTDHFSPRYMRTSYAPGDRVHAPEGFPYEIRKVSLLSSAWGHGWAPLNGATVFTVDDRSAA